ncbi:pentatricopeptide repeat-containing protein At1g80270, mitochondrial-like [Andrographis paniculata]|uniref:pentatricopeptide repeat-containing protein At1g80270, mitochondrial-like n=1 Tax=Andrographis paniculata TaxID=175694 RepID=UPI0021E85E61|nr:pentatricopeptide repeat-containing protein At1g80270, mitochondrial-like [Andrographis paniculata]XP_051148829.1 pentatricopeptide repeat-containing protein At1g80270, mitochondrial-like [Andrographis paniculata]XP_051148830.1 pentatricopeptide repeat-containing protein At1g80270, mitochondrial-like [Andrographis paniculata]
MWALRRASVHLRNREVTSGTTQIFCISTDITRCNSGNLNFRIIESLGHPLNELKGRTGSYNTLSGTLKTYSRIIGSLLSTKPIKGQNDDRDYTFTDPGKSRASVLETAPEVDVDDSSISESEFVGDETVDENMQNELEHLGTEIANGEMRSPATKAIPAMAAALHSAPSKPIGKFMNEWVEKGNEVTTSEISSTMIYLRRRKMFFRALQLLEWLESTGRFELTESSYASWVDLLAKVDGIPAAEKYLKKLPESCKGELVYRTFLANCVFHNDQKKAEEVFNRMKDLFPISDFACNQMLLLYKRVNQKKITDILNLMKENNIKTSSFAYEVLIAIKAHWNDIKGMEQLFVTMKSEGLEPNSHIKSIMAKRYAIRGLNDKAEALLKEIEGDDLTKNRWASPMLLSIYALLGKEDEVERIWKICESNLRQGEYLAGIQAWGKLNRIDAAEEVFNKMVKTLKVPAAKHYMALLDVYASHKMFEKGKELVKRMANIPVGSPYLWHVLVKLYIGGGEVEKAESILDNALRRRKVKPWFISYMTVLKQYAEEGKLHNAERMLDKIRKTGYLNLAPAYWVILNAYVGTKTPAYGFKERLRGDNIVLDDSFARLLDRANPFRKSTVGELLE